MLRSLRARLVLFCVLPLVVAGVVMAPLALRAFDDYQSQRNEEALRQLQEQSAALAALYGKQVRRYFEEGGEPAPVDKELATVTGADLYYVDRLDGILPAEAVALPVLGGVDVDWDALDRGESQTLRSVALPGRDGRYLLVVTGVFTTDDPGGAEDLGAVGAFALAAPVEDLSGSGTDLFWRVAPAFAVAIVVAMLLALYLGWEVSRPLRRLVVAAGGDRPRALRRPPRPHAPRRDRRREPRVRRHGRPPARGAGARAPLPDARLPRAAHAADRRSARTCRRWRTTSSTPRRSGTTPTPSSATRRTGWGG
jgi:hypothetical protein